jgi:hypothetical protein
MTRAPSLAFVLVAALTLAAPARASCTVGGPGLGFVDIGGMVYIDHRGPEGGIWVYQESNGQPGLERGGCSPFVPDDCEPCWDGHGGHDTLVLGG